MKWALVSKRKVFLAFENFYFWRRMGQGTGRGRGRSGRLLLKITHSWHPPLFTSSSAKGKLSKSQVHNRRCWCPKLCPSYRRHDDQMTHVLLHLVKSSCPNSVNPSSTLFSADIQHNCPIFFCICRPYFPPWLAFRFSIKKWLHLHFQGKWPLSPCSFEQLSFALRFILQNEWKC